MLSTGDIISVYIIYYCTLWSGIWLGTGIAQVCAYFPSGVQGKYTIHKSAMPSHITQPKVQCLAVLHNQECNERFIIYQHFTT